jgi:hypothetical protein
MICIPVTQPLKTLLPLYGLGVRPVYKISAQQKVRILTRSGSDATPLTSPCKINVRLGGSSFIRASYISHHNLLQVVCDENLRIRHGPERHCELGET